jgi:hypothetical protein
MLKIPHCLDNRLGDGCKFVSPTHRPEGLGKLKKLIRLIGSRTLDFSAFSIVSELLRYDKYTLNMEVVHVSETLVPIYQSQGVTLQRTGMFLVTAARTSNSRMIDLLSGGNSQ